ncbi:MAG: hypothetical protein LYZ70_03240 [Nitrososphaerales archaeon]|nr:hypothetical protein [Nitrososphaerales archaeon]
MTLAIEIGLVLLGAGVALALVLLAGPRGYLRRRRNKGSGVTSMKATSAPVTGQAKAVAPAASWLAPSPSPAAYETVQPKPAPGVGQFSSSAWTALGASTDAPRRTTTYRRRTIPTRSTATRDKTENKSV